MKIIKVTSKNKDEIAIEATHVLKKGSLIIFPTETVYGLGADPFNKKAVMKIYKAKGRDFDKPLQLLISDLKQVKKYSRNIRSKVLTMMKKNWPGPLTIIVKKRSVVPSFVTGRRETVGLRMPDHDIALDIIRAFGRPIAATSANKSGKKPPKTAKEAMKYFKTGISLVIDGGKTKTGKPSIVIDATGKKIKVLRK